MNAVLLFKDPEVDPHHGVFEFNFQGDVGYTGMETDPALLRIWDRDRTVIVPAGNIIKLHMWHSKEPEEEITSEQ